MTPAHGILVLDGWQGRTESRVIVLAETPKRFRITPAGDKPVRLAGRSRKLRPGEVALVPKHAVRMVHVVAASQGDTDA